MYIFPKRHLTCQELRHARAIRSRIVEIFEKASIPTRSISEKRQLLHIVVVGGGPTGIEVQHYRR